MPATAGDVDDDVDGLGDERPRRIHGHFENQLLQAQQRAQCGAGMDGGDAAGMASAPHLDEIQRLATTYLADHHAVGAQPHRGAHQLGHRHDAGTRAQRHVVACRALQFDGVFEHQYAVARGGDFRE